jgi:hypothetical protein
MPFSGPRSLTSINFEADLLACAPPDAGARSAAPPRLTARWTPEMAKAVRPETRLWDFADIIVALIDAREGPAKKRGPYRMRQTLP